MTKANTITKNCKRCGKEFEVDNSQVIGFRMSDLVHYCDSCVVQIDRESKIAKARNKWASIVPERYRDTDIEDPRFNKKLWKGVKAINLKDHLGFGIVGSTGKCKTRCMALYIKRFILKGQSVRWANSSKFTEVADNRKWKDYQGDQARKNISRWTYADVLVLEDLGKQQFTDKTETLLYDILEQRTANYKRTLWTANTDPKMWEAEGMIYKKDRAEPIVGRLLEDTQIIVRA